MTATTVRGLLSRSSLVTVVALGMFGFFAIFASNFASQENIYSMLRLAATTLLIALPLTFLLIVGEFDLSVGANYGFAAVLTAIAIAHWGWSPWVSSLFVIAACAGVGLLNAVLSVTVGIPSFITTIGMLNLLAGLSLSVTGGQAVGLPASEATSTFARVTGGTVGGLPVQVIWGTAAFIAFGLVLRYTVFAAHVYATGSNMSAAARLGVGTHMVKTACFVLVGAGCGLAGVLATGWLGSGNPTTGQDATLDLYAAVIIGGAALTGGVGTVYGTAIGALIISMLQSGLILLGVQGSWVQFFEGLLILIAGAGTLLSIGGRSELARLAGRLRASVVRDRARERRPSSPTTPAAKGESSA